MSIIAAVLVGYAAGATIYAQTGDTVFSAIYAMITAGCTTYCWVRGRPE